MTTKATKMTTELKSKLAEFVREYVKSKKYQSALQKIDKLGDGEYIDISLTSEEILKKFSIDYSLLEEVKQELVQLIHEQPVYSGSARRVQSFTNNGVKIRLFK